MCTDYSRIYPHNPIPSLLNWLIPTALNIWKNVAMKLKSGIPGLRAWFGCGLGALQIHFWSAMDMQWSKTEWGKALGQFRYLESLTCLDDMIGMCQVLKNKAMWPEKLKLVLFHGLLQWLCGYSGKAEWVSYLGCSLLWESWFYWAFFSLSAALRTEVLHALSCELIINHKQFRKTHKLRIRTSRFFSPPSHWSTCHVTQFLVWISFYCTM